MNRNARSFLSADRAVVTCLALGLSILGPAVVSARADRGALCADCHQQQAGEFANSAHAAAGLDCRACHQGAAQYPVAPADMGRLRAAAEEAIAGRASERFDHGSTFRGKPARRDIPELCSTCHSDLAMMNPYGLPADQLAQYKLSGHGRALYERNDERVAVCIDCHRSHNILKPKDSASSVFPANIPATCGRCHADPKVMAGSGRSTNVVAEYRESIHGHALLEKGDTGMPNCATCHGSHSAVPPGFRDVGHVCGRCHQQEEHYFLESIHAKFESFPRCVVCHTRRVDLRDHAIHRVAIQPEAMEKTYAAVVSSRPAEGIDDPALQQAYAARRVPAVQPFGKFCQRCHNPEREVGHRQFFGELDEKAVQIGNSIYELTRQAELRYGSTAHRVEQMQHGILLVKDEAMMLEELRTKVVGLAAQQHTLNLEKISEAAAAQNSLADEIHASLDAKVRGLRWRHWTLVPMWAFVVVFVGALWTKYKRLKHALVEPMPPEHGGQAQ